MISCLLNLLICATFGAPCSDSIDREGREKETERQIQRLRDSLFTIRHKQTIVGMIRLESEYQGKNYLYVNMVFQQRKKDCFQIRIP